MHMAVVAALRGGDMQAFFTTRGYVVVGNSPEEARRFVTGEIDKWGRIVKASGARVD